MIPVFRRLVHLAMRDLVVEIDALKKKRDEFSGLMEAETAKNWQLQNETVALDRCLASNILVFHRGSWRGAGRLNACAHPLLLAAHRAKSERNLKIRAESQDSYTRTIE